MEMELIFSYVQFLSNYPFFSSYVCHTYISHCKRKPSAEEHIHGKVCMHTNIRRNVRRIRTQQRHKDVITFPPTNGMTSTMMMPEKKVFRARVLDPTKRLQIRLRQKCRTQSPKIKRAVAVPPSGMEKDEEMESHLQQAIFAQKATSAGVIVENHVIPTPKVSTIDDDLYEKIYKKGNSRSKKLIVFKDFISFFLNQSIYDADSEDEEWLTAKPNIPIDHFEQIMLKLELSSQSDIIQPSDAKALLQRYDSQIVDDVYDYWLQKRKQIASNVSKYNVLLARLNTEVRRDEKTINPYLAFRRRLDKVQTRKKQKTEIQTYEKILRLNYAMKRSIALVEMMKQREKAKLALVDIGETLFDQQYQLEDAENRELDRILAEVAAQLAMTKFSVPEVPPAKKKATAILSPPLSPSSEQLENGKPLFSSIFVRPKYYQRRKIRPAKSRTYVTHYKDENIVNEAWLKRNDELWNAITPATAANVGISALLAAANASSVFSSAAGAETMNLIAKYDVNSSVDGRYQFMRKFGCQYRAPTAMTLDTERFTAPTMSSISTALVGPQMKVMSFLQGQSQSVVDSSKKAHRAEKTLRAIASDGEDKFVVAELRRHTDDNDDADVYGWPLLRRSPADKRTRCFHDAANRVLTPRGGKSAGVADDFLTTTVRIADVDDIFTPILAAAHNNRPEHNTNNDDHAFGFIRRRIGRGGRVIFDLKC